MTGADGTGSETQSGRRSLSHFLAGTGFNQLFRPRKVYNSLDLDIQVAVEPFFM